MHQKFFKMKREKQIGIRIPRIKSVLILYQTQGNPIVTTSVNLAGETNYVNPDNIKKDWYGKVDLNSRRGELSNAPPTIISLVDENIEIIRQGKGIFDF